MLLGSYKKDENITLSSIEEMYKDMDNSRVLMDKVLKYNISNNTKLYWVNGKLSSYENNKRTDFKIMVIMNLDTTPSFAIVPWDYVESLGWDNIAEGDTIDIDKIDYTFEKNEYNTFKYQSSTNETMAQEYFEIYKFNIVNNKEEAYKTLDSEYSKAKFGDQSNFENYIANNISKITTAKLNRYQITEKEGYMQYVCIDSNGRYYIFRAKSVLDYKVLLDTYTINIPEFLTKYNEVTDQEKVILNLNKFMLAINDKDYKVAYSMLADSFKTTNFKTEQEFKNYIENNFFNENEFAYEKFGNEANTYYTYDVKITDKTKADTKEIRRTFIVLLEEGTNFKLSFNLQSN